MMRGRHRFYRNPDLRHGPRYGAITGWASASLNATIAMNVQYRELTGKDAYLYTSQPGDGQIRMIFTDGLRLGWKAGEVHMRELLTEALAKRAEEEHGVLH